MINEDFLNLKSFWNELTNIGKKNEFEYNDVILLDQKNIIKIIANATDIVIDRKDGHDKSCIIIRIFDYIYNKDDLIIYSLDHTDGKILK